jgi:hypothetical protein
MCPTAFAPPGLTLDDRVHNQKAQNTIKNSGDSVWEGGSRVAAAVTVVLGAANVPATL